LPPLTPYDAKGLLTAAIPRRHPVIFLEHKMLYLNQTGLVPEEKLRNSLGKADINAPGPTSPSSLLK